jgi:hypothetical protein
METAATCMHTYIHEMNLGVDMGSVFCIFIPFPLSLGYKEVEIMVGMTRKR